MTDGDLDKIGEKSRSELNSLSVCCNILTGKMEFTNLRFVFHDGTEALVTMRNRLFHELSLLEAPSGLPSHYMNLNTVTWPEWTSGNVPEDLVKLLYRNCIDYHFLMEKEDNVVPYKVIVFHT